MPEIKKPWVETPLIESAALSRAAGCRIFLKLENLQPAGSFKSRSAFLTQYLRACLGQKAEFLSNRGIGNYLLQRIEDLPDPSSVHFYSSSGGNAGLACVTAARSLGYPATVIVPESTKPRMIAKIRTAGATDVIQHGATWKEADTYLQQEVLKKDSSGVYVPPFDHPDIWEGSSTLVDEVNTQLPGKSDAIFCSVGGGGLFNGVMRGLDKHSWTDIPVLAMETHGADSLASSLNAGKLVTLPGITSIATSLGATRVADQTFEYGKRKNVKSVVLSDAEAAMGCWRLADDERMLVETASGVSLAVCYDGRLKKLIPGLGHDSKVVVVVCGGSNMTLEMLVEYKQTYGDVERLTTSDLDVPSTHTAPDF
ncbi:MAG: hypothetical protein M1830_005495 [Pleopsidium flavum]|nr:MAG: hypothetical protein M1830_005495 [Pleopsidium flavum]